MAMIIYNLGVHTNLLNEFRMYCLVNNINMSERIRKYMYMDMKRANVDIADYDRFGYRIKSKVRRNKKEDED